VSYQGTATASSEEAAIESGHNKQGADGSASLDEEGQRDPTHSNEHHSKEDLRIGWEQAAHLFTGTGESLCGRSGVREDMSRGKVRKYTSLLSYPVGHLRSVEKVTQFANGICGNCLRSYYSRYSHAEPTNYLDVYSTEIRESDTDVQVGFCRQCGSTVDPERSGGAYVDGEHYAHKCVECTERRLSSVIESFEAITNKREQR
jgi:hypothetical protein